MANAKIIFDTHQYPLVYIAYPDAFSDEAWDDLIAQFDPLLDRKQPFGWVNDARTPHLPNARNRAALAAHHKKRAADYREWAKGAATVSQSRLVRGVITAIEWIHPAPFPHRLVSTTAEAERFVRGRLGLSSSRLTIAPMYEQQSKLAPAPPRRT